MTLTAAPTAAALPRISDTEPPRSRLRRLAPLAVLAAGTAAFFALGLPRYLSFGALREHRSELMSFVANHGLLAPLLFIALYAEPPRCPCRVGWSCR